MGTPAFADNWLPNVMPCLDEFVESFKGNVNIDFWQTMVKLRATHGSGAREWISGWIQNFFPYLKGGAINNTMRPWHEMCWQGPDPESFPAITSSVPVDWNYRGTELELLFSAGILGYTQDPASGCLEPALGWRVTHHH